MHCAESPDRFSGTARPETIKVVQVLVSICRERQMWARISKGWIEKPIAIEVVTVKSVYTQTYGLAKRESGIALGHVIIEMMISRITKN